MGASRAHRLASEINPAGEYKKWESGIKNLAADLHKPETQIRAIFQSEMQQLENAARVKNFISILALRRVKELLRFSQSSR